MALACSRGDIHFAFGNSLCVLGLLLVGGGVGFYHDNVLACSGRGLDVCHTAYAGAGGSGFGY
jgi:hypothetical protein